MSFTQYFLHLSGPRPLLKVTHPFCCLAVALLIAVERKVKSTAKLNLIYLAQYLLLVIMYVELMKVPTFSSFLTSTLALRHNIPQARKGLCHVWSRASFIRFVSNNSHHLRNDTSACKWTPSSQCGSVCLTHLQGESLKKL